MAAWRLCMSKFKLGLHVFGKIQHVAVGEAQPLVHSPRPGRLPSHSHLCCCTHNSSCSGGWGRSPVPKCLGEVHLQSSIQGLSHLGVLLDDGPNLLKGLVKRAAASAQSWLQSSHLQPSVLGSVCNSDCTWVFVVVTTKIAPTTAWVSSLSVVASIRCM